MPNDPRDPRTEDEKARADLARNAELGLAVPESPLEKEPSVTPKTFGETGSGSSSGGDEADSIGDSTGTSDTSRDIPPRRSSNTNDEDVLSRAKE